MRATVRSSRTFRKSLKQLQALGIQYRVVFLEAEEPILVKRFKETRRKHPMTDDATPLLEAVRLEKQLLEPLSFAAGLRIDTTTPRRTSCASRCRVLRAARRHRA